MTQNLRLVGPKTLDAATTNIASGETFNLATQNSNSWCSVVSEEAAATCYSQSLNLSTGNTDYGTYYNWYTATAGSGTYDSIDINVSSSICSRGWQLPTAFNDNSSDYKKLAMVYSIDTLAKATAFPTEFVLSGDRYGDGNRYQGRSGSWWSSSAYETDHYRGRNAYISDTRVLFANTNGKDLGLAVRCVAK